MMDSDVPSEAKAPGAPKRSRFGQAVRRFLPNHWGKILFTWAILTVGVGCAIYLHVRPLYESSSLLRVEPAMTNLFGLGTEAEAFDHFLQTQVELIKSPSVVASAIASNPRLANTALLRGSRDPEGELRARLRVGVLPGTFLIRVGLETPDPADGPPIISEVVHAYLAVAAAWSSEKNAYQIKRLEKYSFEVSERIADTRREWVELAQKGVVDLQSPPVFVASARQPGGDDWGWPGLVPKPGSIDEYRQFRTRLFEIDMQVIETEALLEKRKADHNAQEDASIRELELAAQLDSLKVLKGAYEKHLPRLKLLDEQMWEDAVKLAMVREDLAGYREMRASVEKRIEQLKFDSQGQARINEIDPAKPNAIPIKDARRKLMALTPVIALAVALCLFLGLELVSSGRTERDEIVTSA
jgi:uncharacterized protein involved in exopolysaccharide biosynthesis